MRFLFEYRTPDNTKHDGVISAANRDAAYAALKKQGIKPCRFSEAPGFFNKLFGKGKRWMAIVVLAVALCGSIYYSVVRLPASDSQTGSETSVAPRHQIASLPADWADCIDSVFSDDLDRMLALYSQPGVVVLMPKEESRRAVAEGDEVWTDTLRQVVAGMREDANGYLKLGKSMSELEKFLDERQKMECAYREQLLRQLKSGTMKKDEVNATLNAVGMKTVE